MMAGSNTETIRENAIKKQIELHHYDSQLYHYTSIDALYGILKNNELWLGNMRTMNDKAEVKFFIRELYSALRKNLPPECQEQCKKLFEMIKRRAKNEYPYALSLSRLEDNAAQWDRYANHGAGVCIAFNTYKLMSLFYYGFLFCEVYYNRDITEHQHYGILYELLTTGRLDAFNELKSLIDNILVCAYIHKDKSFCTEEEVRAATLWKRIPWKSNPGYTTVDYVLMNGIIKNVLKLHLDKICDGENIEFEKLFNSIVIGPCSKQNEQELKDFIKSIGYPSLAQKVRKSKCSLR